MQELQAQEAAEAIWDQIQELVQEIWADVFGKANKILTAHTRFGFTEIEKGMNPSLQAIVLSLKTIESSLDSLDSSGVLDYEEQRLVINAKTQINNVQRVALALDQKDQDEYEKAIEILRKQAPF